MDELLHYGIKRRSGRYPYGSGENPQRGMDILSIDKELRKQGLDEKAIAEHLGMNTRQLRDAKSIAKEERQRILHESIPSMKKHGFTDREISEKLGISETTVRNYKSPKEINTTKQINNIVDTIKKSADKTGYLDVGLGVEREMGISREKMSKAIEQLKSEGYNIQNVYIRRLTDPSKFTTIKVLTKETDMSTIVQNADKIRSIQEHTGDGGFTFQGIKPPKNIDMDRVFIKYGDKGGSDKDGIIELRRGVEDLDLGKSHYAQVRIAVNGTHYLKGVALYSDNIPAGKDIVFNTNKKSGTPPEKVLKELKDNPDNPFGANIKPGGQRGALNIVNEEGSWDSWSNTLSSQFLSKQPLPFVKERLNKTYDSIKKEYDELSTITHPQVRRHLMEAYADNLKSKARHLKVQGIPGQKNHIITPFTDIKPNEVYAPNYKNGDRVALVRHPHGGIFEIPDLVVNNTVKSAKKILGNAIDAIGIHPSVAEKLSGADFDGDSVLVIPNNNRKVKSAPRLKDLEGFDPQQFKVDRATITDRARQTQMGIVSNLITDMTIKKASSEEIARAVKHSMVVIDALKHNLDWKASAREYGISDLAKKYQTHISMIDGKKHTAASTLISRAKKDYHDSMETSKYKRKKYIMDEIEDANLLSSGTPVEKEYATYINKLKGLENKTRKEILDIPNSKTDLYAKKIYKDEIESLNNKIDIAILNAPKERQAQVMASNTFYSKFNKDVMTKDDIKKLKTQALDGARKKLGIADRKDREIVITDKEWEAIQANAISQNKLDQILKYGNLDVIRKHATPRETFTLSPKQYNLAMSRLNNGYTTAEVAISLGISVDSLKKALASI